MTSRQVSALDLPLRVLDHSSPIPLYHQIETDLKQLILSGDLAPDDVLPPENDLSRVYGVGRHTMRMALSRLTRDGFISRQAGRGTFIRYRKSRTRFYLDRSFTRQMADMGMKAHSRVIRTSNGVLDEHSPAQLRQNLGAAYFSMSRLRFGDDEPVGLQTTTILTRLCPGIETQDFNEQSLYDVLFNVYKLVITRIVHTISACIADRSQADLLNVKLGAPLLLVNTCAYVDQGEMIEFTVSYYRADKYEYSTTHTYAVDAVGE